MYAAAADTLAAEVEALGGRIGYASTSAPLVFVDVPAPALESLAARSDVLSLGLEGTSRETMTSAGATVAANWTTGSGDQGNGVRVGVLEYHNAANTGDLSGQVVQRWSVTGQVVTSIHPRGSRVPSAAGTARGAGSRPGPTSSARRPADSLQGSPATARSSRPPTGRCRPVAATWTS